MLVLSRRADESIQFPNLGITIRVLRLSSKRARIGIEAPPEFAVIRGELSEVAQKTFENRVPQSTSRCLQQHICEASDVLTKLYHTMESCDWQDSEPLVFALFNQLKAMDEQVANLSHGVGPTGQPTKKSALIVDDCENESRLLASYLRLKDICVETAKDGGDAITYLASNPIPDVIVLDMNMPRFDGSWTVREVRAQSKFDDTKIYAVSGMEPGDCDVEFGPNGIDRWFPKPLNPEELIDQIHQATYTAASAI